ncbi:ATP synthase epsilon chain [Frankliniella fusca]|uniref:ATP synthase epsilon chain n=1 Tax=Frankliniella fusca TaxID=407009 RepID=A0AAE1HY16_9NEOP|nr:ATP synthase epsilon chain [Frankliniella fusca]
MSPPSEERIAGGAPRRRRSTEKSTPSVRRNTSSFSIADLDLGSEFDVDLELANVSGGEEESPTPITALATSDRAPPRAHQQDGSVRRSWFETPRRAPDLFMNPKRIRMSAGADDTLSPAVRGRLGAGAEHSPPVSPSVSLPSSAPTTCRTSGTRDARDKDATLSSRTSSRVSIGVGVLYINSTRAQSSRPQQPDTPATGRARNDVSSSPQDLAGADPSPGKSQGNSI